MPNDGATFGDVQKNYAAEELPTLAKSSARMYQSDIKHLLGEFGVALLSKVTPMHKIIDVQLIVIQKKTK